MSRPFSIAILAFDEVEALDLAGPYEVFTTASRMAQRPEAATWPGQARVASWWLRSAPVPSCSRRPRWCKLRG